MNLFSLAKSVSKNSGIILGLRLRVSEQTRQLKPKNLDVNFSRSNTFCWWQRS